MSRHGQVILNRMIELIDGYEAGSVTLRGLVDDLNALHESLDPAEQPPERAWLDAVIPLDRLLGDRDVKDHEEIHGRVAGSLAKLRDLITARRAAVSRAGR